jgi:hypothetical protein
LDLSCASRDASRAPSIGNRWAIRGVDELIPELFETEFEEDGTCHGSFTLDDQLVSYAVMGADGRRLSPRGGSSDGQSPALIMLRSRVQVSPAPPTRLP